MEVIINILKIILLSVVIAFVGFQLGKFINDIQVRKFNEESEDKIILPERDICDSCKYLKVKNTDEDVQENSYRYVYSKFNGWYDSCPETCCYYSPSNLVKQSDITQVTVGTDSIHDATDKEYNDDMFDIRPLLESATNVCKAAYWRDTSSRYISECSECKQHHYRRSMWCPNCHSFMSNNED